MSETEPVIEQPEAEATAVVEDPPIEDPPREEPPKEEPEETPTEAKEGEKEPSEVRFLLDSSSYMYGYVS